MFIYNEKYHWRNEVIIITMKSRQENSNKREGERKGVERDRQADSRRVCVTETEANKVNF